MHTSFGEFLIIPLLGEVGCRALCTTGSTDTPDFPCSKGCCVPARPRSRKPLRQAIDPARLFVSQTTELVLLPDSGSRPPRWATALPETLLVAALEADRLRLRPLSSASNALPLSVLAKSRAE